MDKYDVETLKRITVKYPLNKCITFLVRMIKEQKKERLKIEAIVAEQKKTIDRLNRDKGYDKKLELEKVIDNQRKQQRKINGEIKMQINSLQQKISSKDKLINELRDKIKILSA